jgi:hypothetical protein
VAGSELARAQRKGRGHIRVVGIGDARLREPKKIRFVALQSPDMRIELATLPIFLHPLANTAQM